MNYPVHCECGNDVLVSSVDAGRRVACVCGKAVEVPNLSELRRMKPAAGNSNATHPDRRRDSGPESAIKLRSGWGWLLTGLAILVAGLLLSANGQTVGMFFTLFAIVPVAVGLMRLVGGMVRRKSDEPPPQGSV